jgi:FkbM family methyltransferase
MTPLLRPGTQDAEIWHEVRADNCYRLPERMGGWAVLDVGAHIGLFALECLGRGAARVVCVEPWPANARLLLHNTAGWPVELVCAAVAAPGVATVTLSDQQFGADRTAMIREAREGMAAAGVPLDVLIGRLGGRVDLLKLDCEGGEFPGLLHATRLGRVDRVALEWHAPTGDPADLVVVLERAGFALEHGLRNGDYGTGLLFAARPR